MQYSLGMESPIYGGPLKIIMCQIGPASFSLWILLLKLKTNNSFHVFIGKFFVLVWLGLGFIWIFTKTLWESHVLKLNLGKPKAYPLFYIPSPSRLLLLISFLSDYAINKLIKFMILFKLIQYSTFSTNIYVTYFLIDKPIHVGHLTQ